jgi:thymidylate synthase (FAD)
MSKIDVLDKGFVELINCLGDDEIVARTAKISYFNHDKELTDKEKEELIAKLIKNGHTSPFEQVEFQFLVKCPIFVARQWMRHRTWSYNEMSRRYVDTDFEFYVPKNLGKKVPDNVLNLLIEGISKSYEMALKQYNLLLRFKTPAEKARIGLPLGLYTEFYAKTDLHNLFHFLELRGSEHAQEEIREYVKAIEQLIAPILPISYKYWKESLD